MTGRSVRRRSLQYSVWRQKVFQHRSGPSLLTHVPAGRGRAGDGKMSPRDTSQEAWWAPKSKVIDGI